MKNQQSYTILLVDDESEVRKRIVSKIPDDGVFSVVGEASNGFDALELIDKLKPNVVITDIRMPYIDGIELSKIIRKNYPKTKIAFISGYDEFSYAKEAIDLDVISYLSKPVGDEEVVSFLDKLKERLDEEHQQVFNQDRIDQMYKDSLPALIENQFNSLLQLSTIHIYDLKRFNIFGIDLLKDNFMIAMVEIEDDEDFLATERLRIFLINLVKNKFASIGSVFSINSGHGLIFVIQYHQTNVDLESIFYDVVLLKKDFSNIKIRIGLSETFKDFKQFSEYVLQAKRSLTFSNYLNIGSVIYYKDVAYKKKVDLQLTRQEIDEISYVIRFGSESEVNDLFDKHRQLAMISQDYLFNKQYYMVNIVHVLLDFASSLHVEMRDVIQEDLLEKLSNISDIDELFDSIKQLISELRKQAANSTKSKANEVLEEAVAFLSNNYFDPNINMDVLCEKLGVSVSYLSALFKKIMKTTFNKYLINLRMEKAKELLKYGNDKIYEIANQVGYNDVYYFSYSFKKATGVAPKDYRHDKETE